jgi:hypothetical protein
MIGSDLKLSVPTLQWVWLYGAFCEMWQASLRSTAPGRLPAGILRWPNFIRFLIKAAL